MGILRIPEIPQYGVLIEEKYDKEESLFHEVYQGAIENVYDIISRQKNTENELFLNPCIAFVGKRGTGKSSAMSSFANFLANNKPDNCTWIEDEKIKKAIIKSKFYTLPAIDTANMEEKETIIADVSAEMFAEYEKVSASISVDKKRTFIKDIKTTNDTAILKSSGEWTKQGDQLLSETNKIVHIKDLFTKVVNSFLTIVKNNVTSEDCYLVIQIDDLDMNISNAYSIMEEIRTILTIKNVIVLLSVDIDQLKTVLRINFEEPLKNLTLFNDLEKHSEKNKIARDLAYKYIEKLLPFNRRHYMPELTVQQLTINKSGNFLGDNDTNWVNIGLVKKDGETPNIFDAAMHLIWRKTMLIPMRDEYGDVLLLPHNLRSLCNFIVFLRNMKDAAYSLSISPKKSYFPLTFFDYSDETIGETYRNILEGNLRSFSKYIVSSLETFQRPEMNTEEENLANMLLALIDSLANINTEELNYKIAEDILAFFSSSEPPFNNSKHDNNMLTALRENDMVSIGDLIYLLRQIDKKTHCGYIRYLVSIVRTLWSIKMTYELYVIGCNSQLRTLYGQPETNFITKVFRNNIGSMIINPDVSESFLSEFEYPPTDWSYCEKKKCQSIYDLTLPKNMVKFDSNHIMVENVNHRVRLKTGEAPYEYYNEHKLLYNISHPVCVFSNLLSPYFKKGTDIYTKWQNKFIMVFPFYSMDFMYRLIEEYFKEVKINLLNGKVSVMYHVINMFKKATNNLMPEISKYIPDISVSYTNNDNISLQNNSQLTNQASENKYYFSFTEPINHLLDDFSWNEELVMVNLELVSKLNECLGKLENEEHRNSNFIRDVLACINPYLPQCLLDVFDAHPAIEEKIAALNELSHLLDEAEPSPENSYYKKAIVPFFYSKPLENFPSLESNDHKNAGE